MNFKRFSTFQLMFLAVPLILANPVSNITFEQPFTSSYLLVQTELRDLVQELLKYYKK